MRKWVFREKGSDNKIHWCVSIGYSCGIGFYWSPDSPVTYRPEHLIELRLFLFKAWVVFPKRTKR